MDVWVWQLSPVQTELLLSSTRAPFQMPVWEAVKVRLLKRLRLPPRWKLAAFRISEKGKWMEARLKGAFVRLSEVCDQVCDSRPMGMSTENVRETDNGHQNQNKMLRVDKLRLKG